jgi:hypothetical protein
MTLALTGCGAPSGVDASKAQERYLAAKTRCVSEYPDRLVPQSDCRTQAANIYIRPFYKYGDLMTRAQEQRRVVAIRADNHEITRKAYDRQIAQLDAAIAREEDRRNKTDDTATTQQTAPNFLAAVSGLFR